MFLEQKLSFCMNIAESLSFKLLLIGRLGTTNSKLKVLNKNKIRPM